MNLSATLIASILGMLLGGFPGFILGLIVGFAIDSGIVGRWRSGQSYFKYHQADIQHIFFDTTFQVMGFLAKANGRVTEKDIQTAEAIMQSMGLNSLQRKRATELFNEGKQPQFNISAAIDQLRRACWFKPSLLRTFLEIQIQMAFAEGHLTPRKRQALQQICQQMGLMGFNFDQFEQRFRAEQNYGYYQQSRNTGSFRSSSQVSDAYQILGVSSTATEAEVKKAYRRLMSQYHPDRLIAKGLPEEMIKMATEKTQSIKKAYEDICQQKGW